MSANLPLTAKRLRKVITYDPTSGAFHWKLSRPGCVAGREAGTVRPDGYRQVEIDRKLYRAARLAVLYVTGKWPASDKVVDHRNGVRDDDRWSNLRVATLAENARNRRPTAASGKLGVYAYSGGRWYASIWLNGKTKHLDVYLLQ